MTEAEIKQVASTAAQEALEKFLLVLGVNVSTPADKIELQKDFSHLRQARLIGGFIGGKILGAIAGSIGTGLVAAVVFYVTKH